MVQNFLKLPLLFFVLAAFFSCKQYRSVQFSLGSDIENKLFASSRAAREGTLDLSKPKKLEYHFDDSFIVKPNSSLVIVYDFNIPVSEKIRKNFSLALNMGEISWELPFNDDGIQYAVPIEESFDGNFSITLNGIGKIEKDGAPIFQIRSVRFSGRWFGFQGDLDKYFYITPFVSKRDDKSYVIDVPESFMPTKQLVEIRANFSAGNAALEFDGRRIEALPGAAAIYIHPYFYSASGQVIFSSDEAGAFYIETLREPQVFPQPIPADPALVLSWPKKNWRKSAYEIFRWEDYPLLIFDMADYAVQDRMLKRLAFFVEKSGFRGRLAPDEEIADLHGWNAHDYKADDLASFFDLARRTNFPLLDEEKQLEKILLNEGIIREKASDVTPGGITAGAGGIISISRESADYLRYRFMAHEGFHGLFFIDEDFRNFSLSRWGKLPVTAKRFIISFFEFQQYDTKDEYLLINEFMAHVLQQPVSQAAGYFGKNLPERLETTWRAGALPKKDEATGAWPELASAFTAEAEAFSAYVSRRWGLAAGRVWTLRVN